VARMPRPIASLSLDLARNRRDNHKYKSQTQPKKEEEQSEMKQITWKGNDDENQISLFEKKNCLLTRADRISLEFLSCFMARKDFSQLSPTTFFFLSLSFSFLLFFQLLLAIRYYKQEW
jgi:hypothetical protein